ncbi:MAG: hypothetical protein FWF23_03860 [Alphaproteobacteria bacterium]|nr:hypothetical protein [Alphaproteobacteria bacterium]MCL2505199.1 hypothetical protein [Alphaproteobacteria bacterium]
MSIISAVCTYKEDRDIKKYNQDRAERLYELLIAYQKMKSFCSPIYARLEMNHLFTESEYESSQQVYNRVSDLVWKRRADPKITARRIGLLINLYQHAEMQAKYSGGEKLDNAFLQKVKAKNDAAIKHLNGSFVRRGIRNTLHL